MDYQFVKKVDKELIYYSIYNTELELQDGSDMLCSARRKYFEAGKKRQKNRINSNISGEMIRCSYTIESGKILKWRKLVDTQICERTVPLVQGYYMVESLNHDNQLYKCTYYDLSHKIVSVEFYDGKDRKNPVCTITPSNDGIRNILIRKRNGTEDTLYPFECPIDKQIIEQLNIIAGEPQIFCCTSSGNFYFCNEEETAERHRILEKLLKEAEFYKINEISVSDQTQDNKTKEIKAAHEKDNTGEEQKIDLGVYEEVSEKKSESFDENISLSEADDTEKKICAFVGDCPYENKDKLMIESGGRHYFYFGDILYDKRDGIGRTVMSDGKTAYEGGYKNDERDGFGVYYYKSGKICYAGSWEQNKREGLGIAFSPDDGSAFIGRWHKNTSVGLGASFDKDGNLIYLGKTSDGRRSGTGVTYSAEKGTLFVGQYKDGEYLGRGTQFDSDGNMRYVGGYTHEMRNGNGTSYNSDGTVEYKGEWKNNLYDGEGTLYMEDGCVLKGTFRDGKAYGKCSLTDNMGRMIYLGSFEENVYDGTGRLFAEDGSYVEGRFVDGEPTGIFNEYDKNNDLIYCGEWSGMERSGKGIEYKNGEKVYDGSFRNSLYHGSGKLYRDGVLVYSGSFKYGKRNGLGVQYADNDMVYYGMWKDNRYEGCGILYRCGVPKYVGCFVNGKRHGRINEISEGKIKKVCIYAENKVIYMCEYSADGCIIYFGNAQDGVRSGMGCLYSADCEKEFEGIFKNGEPDKPMQVFYNKPEPLPECKELSDTPYENYRFLPAYSIEERIGKGLYTGQLKDNIPDGKGTMLYSDHRYTGRFVNGRACGHGVIYYQNGSEKSGNFASGTSPDHKKIEFSEVTYYLHEEE